MTIRVAAIEVNHWHALYDAAYLRHLIAMSDVELVAIQDSDASLVARRAAELGSPPTFTDYRKMLATTRAQRIPALAELPTIAESGVPAFEAGGWYGFFTTAGTPREALQKLNASIVAAVNVFSLKTPNTMNRPSMTRTSPAMTTASGTLDQ